MEEIILMCQPVHQALTVLPGSVQRECNDCGTKVWVAPSGQKLVRERTSTIICPKCTLLRIKKEPGPCEISITPEAAQEVKDWVQRN